MSLQINTISAEDTCYICYGKLSEQKITLSHDNLHSCCEICLISWLLRSPTCPVCRKDLVTQSSKINSICTSIFSQYLIQGLSQIIKVEAPLTTACLVGFLSLKNPPFLRAVIDIMSSGLTTTIGTLSFIKLGEVCIKMLESEENASSVALTAIAISTFFSELIIGENPFSAFGLAGFSFVTGTFGVTSAIQIRDKDPEEQKKFMKTAQKCLKFSMLAASLTGVVFSKNTATKATLGITAAATAASVGLGWGLSLNLRSFNKK